MAVSSRQVDGSPSSSGRSRAAGWLRSIALRSNVSISAKSAGSSSAGEAPCRTSSARTRSRTRPCSSDMTLSADVFPVDAVPVGAVTSGAPCRLIRPLEALRGAGADRQRRGGRRDHLVLLLDAERQAIVARQAEGVIGAVPPFDLALSGFVRVAIFRVLGNSAIVPVPLDGGAV